MNLEERWFLPMRTFKSRIDVKKKKITIMTRRLLEPLSKDPSIGSNRPA
jgi:hypothetical protein